MLNSLFTFASLIVIMLFAAPVISAQNTYDLQPHPELAVSGTSTLHDWEMPSTQAVGKMTATEEAGILTAISFLEVTMPAESIKSGKKAMDKKAYEALKTEQHKNVTFRLKEAVKSGDYWTFKGTFNIAGTARDVSLQVKEATASGVHQFTGTYSFDLKEYNITPPTAVMGTIKTGEKVKISFNLKFK